MLRSAAFVPVVKTSELGRLVAASDQHRPAAADAGRRQVRLVTGSFIEGVTDVATRPFGRVSRKYSVRRENSTHDLAIAVSRGMCRWLVSPADAETVRRRRSVKRSTFRLVPGLCTEPRQPNSQIRCTCFVPDTQVLSVSSGFSA